MVHRIGDAPNGQVRCSRFCQAPTSRDGSALPMCGHDDVNFIKQERERAHMAMNESDRGKLPSPGQIAPGAYHDLRTREELSNQGY